MNPLQFIELHFADELFIHAIHEKYVVPHNHSVFSRVDPREGPEIPILSPSQEDIPHQLQLHTFLRYNRLYDVYRGTITSNDLGVPAGIKCPDGNVMVKIMASDTFDDAGWNTETGFDTALEAVYDEAELIEDHLSTIESKPSPGFYGLFVLKIDGRWGLTRQVIVMILEDVTEPIHRHPVSTFAYLKDDLR